MDPVEIQYRLKKSGITQKQIAEQVNRSEMMVSLVVHKHRVSDPIMRAISEALGEHHLKVFPEHYLKRRKASKAA